MLCSTAQEGFRCQRACVVPPTLPKALRYALQRLQSALIGLRRPYLINFNLPGSHVVGGCSVLCFAMLLAHTQTCFGAV